VCPCPALGSLFPPSPALENRRAVMPGLKPNAVARSAATAARWTPAQRSRITPACSGVARKTITAVDFRSSLWLLTTAERHSRHGRLGQPLGRGAQGLLCWPIAGQVRHMTT
jgi:hypothetical protein